MLRTNHKLAILALGIGLAVFTGCDKDENGGPAVNNEIANDFFAAKATPEQGFTIDNSSEQVINTSGGMTVTVPANAFTDKDGNAVTGDIDFDIIEIYEKSDMIFSEKPTISNGNVLISGGEFSFTATKDGEELQLKDNTTINVNSPTSSMDPSMSLFIGGEDPATGEFNWEQLFGNNQLDSANSQAAIYVFDIDTLGWINVDKFYGGSTTSITVNLEEGFTIDQAHTFVVFDNLQSVIGLYGAGSATSYTPSNMPLSEDITVLCVAAKDGRLYVAEESLTITTNATVDLSFSEMTEEQLETLIESMD